MSKAGQIVSISLALAFLVASLSSKVLTSTPVMLRCLPSGLMMPWRPSLRSVQACDRRRP